MFVISRICIFIIQYKGLYIVYFIILCVVALYVLFKSELFFKEMPYKCWINAKEIPKKI